MQKQQMIPARHIIQGRNPRTYFDPAEMAELEQSIRSKGVIQPILVRPVDDGKFEIVAGERRWRASKKVYGEDHPIPALVREISDDEADEFALIENVQRANMSPTEEAEAAAKVLGRCAGDRDETARRLGWNRQTLDSRLALMNCADSVRKALTERKIKIGHAELLAAVTKERQSQVLDKLLIQATLPTVNELKAMLSQIARSLESAVFEKTECTECPHNSGCQRVMFSEAIDAGNCTNGECFDRKTEAALTAKVEAIKEEYPVVRIVRNGDNYTLLPLKADGPTGVGEEQAKACRACSNFGAAVSAVPGKVGNVHKELCFDAACNSRKVAERIKSEKTASTTVKEKSKASSGKAKTPPAKGAASGKKAATVQDSTRIKEYRVKIWRTLLNKQLMADPAKNLVALIALAVSGNARHISDSKLHSALDKLTAGTAPGRSISSDVSGIAAALEHAGEEVITKMHQGIVATAAANIEERTVVDFLNWLKVDITNHWTLNKDYLDLLTKSEIEAIADEIGLKAAVGDKFSKLMTGKKEEAINALLEVEGFDYAGKVPRQLFWES